MRIGAVGWRYGEALLPVRQKLLIQTSIRCLGRACAGRTQLRNAICAVWKNRSTLPLA